MEHHQHRRSRRSSEEIKLLLEKFDSSALSAKEFCKAHSISEGGFYKWKARHANKLKQTQKPVGFATVHITPSPSITGTGGLFAQVGEIKIYQPVSSSFLKELL